MAAGVSLTFTESQLSAFEKAHKTPGEVSDEVVSLRSLDTGYTQGSSPQGPMIDFDKRLHRYPNIRPYLNNNFAKFYSVLPEGMLIASAPTLFQLRRFFKTLGAREVGLIVNLVAYDPSRAPRYTPASEAEPHPFLGGAVACKESTVVKMGSWNVLESELEIRLFEKKKLEQHDPLNSSDEATELMSYLPDSVIRKFELMQIHVSDWEDRTAADDAEMFALASRIDELSQKLGGDAKIVVHCSAGVGRTGQLVNSLQIYRRLREDLSTEIRPFEIVWEALQYRTQFGINDKSQYAQLYSFIEYVKQQLAPSLMVGK